MHKILVLKEAHEHNNRKLQEAISGDYMLEFSTRGTEDYKEKLKEAEVIIGEPSIEDIKGAPNLKWIQMTWAGADFYTKSPEFPKDIIVTNMSGVFGETISEYVIGAILSLYRNFPAYYRNQAEKIWRDMGSEKTLFDKRVLILGAGDIGTSIAKRLRPFGCRNIGVRRTKREYESCFDEMYTLSEAEQLLTDAEKVDTRAAVFVEGKILLVHENNGTWALPGGWCEVDQSVASNTIKEVKEETGLNVSAEKLIAVQDWRKHNVTNYAYGVVKIFVLCKYKNGEFERNIETTEIGFFEKEEIPENLAVEKCTKEQILMCFETLENPAAPTIFD